MKFEVFHLTSKADEVKGGHERLKCPNFTSNTTFMREITALIHKNVIGMFVRCTVYEICISSLCCFGVDQPLCCVVYGHLHNLKEEASCLTLFHFRVESLV